MASCKEISKLVTDMNHTVGSGRPSRNSQIIYDHTLQPTPMPTNLVPLIPVNTTAVPHAPVTTPQVEVIPPKETILQSRIPQALTHQYPCWLQCRIDYLR